MNNALIVRLSQQLQRYLPAGTEEFCARWLIVHNTSLRITRSRKTKLGDFLAQVPPAPHRISVNGDLPPLQFLITLTHEIAHAITWNRYQNRVASHGSEWKRCYQDLLAELLRLEVLAGDETLALQELYRKPTATSTLSCPIYKLTQSKDLGLLLDDLKPGQVFSLGDNKNFRTIKKLRSHWRCTELSSGREYRVHGQVPVTVIEL